MSGAPQMARTGFVIGYPPTCIPCDDSCPIGDVGPWQPARSSSVVVLVQSDDLDLLHGLVWEAHRIAQGCAEADSWYRTFRNVQGGDIADY